MPFIPDPIFKSNQSPTGFIPDQSVQPQKPTRSWTGEILPTGGAILGGIGGAVAGEALGGPLGAYAGGVAGTGLGSAVGEAAQQGIEKLSGKRLSFSPKEVAKTGAEYGALEAVGGPVLTGAGRLLKGAGRAIGEAVIPTLSKETGMLQAYKAGKPLWERALSGLTGSETKAPQTAAKTAFDKGLMGFETGIGIRAKRAGNNLWQTLISPALKKSKTKIDMKSFFKEVEGQIIKENPEKSRQKDLLTALNALKKDYKKVGKVSLEDLQKFKEGWAQFVPEKAYQGKPIAGSFNDIKNMSAEVARTKIYSALGSEVKQAYFDYGNLKSLQELGKKSMAGGKFKGGFGSFFSAIKDMALTPIGTFGGQMLYRAGKKVEFIGQPGANFLRDIIPAPFEVGKELGNGSVGDTGTSMGTDGIIPKSSDRTLPF